MNNAWEIEYIFSSTHEKMTEYSWGEFYETLKEMKESGDEFKNETFEKAHSLFTKLDTLSNIEDVKQAIKEANLSEIEINYINSSCLDGILISMNRGDKTRPDKGYCYASKTVPFFVEIVEKYSPSGSRRDSEYPQYFETFKYYIVRGFVKEDDTFYTYRSGVALISYLCKYYRTDMIEFIYERSKEICALFPYDLDIQKEFITNWTTEPEKSEKLAKIESYRKLIMPKVKDSIILISKSTNGLRINGGVNNAFYE